MAQCGTYHQWPRLTPGTEITQPHTHAHTHNTQSHTHRVTHTQSHTQSRTHVPALAHRSHIHGGVNTATPASPTQMGLLPYIRSGTDPTTVAVMLEDGGAVLGLLVAGKAGGGVGKVRGRGSGGRRAGAGGRRQGEERHS